MAAEVVILRLLLTLAAASAFASPASAALKSGDILVVDPDVPPVSTALLFQVDPQSGARTVIADFGGSSPTAVAVEADGSVLVTDTAAGTNGWGVLYRLSPDPATGELVRTILTDFGVGASTGRNPRAVAVEADGQILVLNGNGGTADRALLVRVNPDTGARAIVSDFGSSGQGGLGVEPRGVALEVDGWLVVIDAQAGTSGQGELVRVDPQSGARTSLSNFGSGANPGSNPTAVTVDATGQILVTDEGHPSTTPLGLLFRVDPQSGARTVLSDFNAGANTGREPEGVALEADGRVLVVDKHAGPLNRGTLFRIDPQSGARAIVSDFGAGANQGDNPLAVAVVPPLQAQAQLVVVNEIVNDDGGTATASDWTITVTGTNPTPASFPGAAPPGTTVTLDAGVYTVATSGPAGYTTTFSAGCAGTIAAGETSTCTITNDDRPATLVVVNEVVNDDGGTAVAFDWTMTVTGANPVPPSFPGAGAPGTIVTLDSGAYTVAQTGPAGYDTTSSADCAGTLVAGETRTCTFINDDRFVAVISVAASPALDFGQVAIGASPSLIGSLVVAANVPYTISVSRTAFTGGDIPLGASLLDPSVGRTATAALPVGEGAVLAAGTASDAPYDWTPIYTIGPVPIRSAGAAAATVTYTVVAQ